MGASGLPTRPNWVKDLSVLVEAAEMRIFIANCQKEQVPPETYNSTALVGTQVHVWYEEKN